MAPEGERRRRRKKRGVCILQILLIFFTHCVCVVLRSDLRQVAVWYLYSSETVTAAVCVCT